MRNLAGEFNVLQDDASQLAKRLPDKKFCAIITPPPYYDYRHYGSNKGEIEWEQAVETITPTHWLRCFQRADIC